MKFLLEIELGNVMQRMSDVRGSFLDATDILAEHSEALTVGAKGWLLDANGNSVGKWEVVDATAPHESGTASRPGGG